MSALHELLGHESKRHPCCSAEHSLYKWTVAQKSSYPNKAHLRSIYCLEAGAPDPINQSQLIEDSGLTGLVFNSQNKMQQFKIDYQ